MGTQSRPGFFCSRPNGTLTPLIAVDDLPSYVSVRGVARTITPDETQGMTSCGVAPSRTEPWIIDGPVSASRNNGQHDANELSDLLIKILREENVSNRIRQLIQGTLLRHLEGPKNHGPVGPNTMGTGQAMMSTNYVNNGNYKPNVNSNKKEYCSYWIRHGECDYQQQGCLYKHEMPTDPAMLERLGLRDIPRWYREKYGIPSLQQPQYGIFRSQTTSVEQPTMRAIQYATQHNNNTSEAECTPVSNNNHHRVTNGRFKSPRGVGFQGRARGGGSWHKVNNSRDNFAQNNAADNTPESSNSVSEDFFLTDATNARLQDLSIDSRDAQESGGVALPNQHLIDKDGMAQRSRLVAELVNLTSEEPIDGTAVKALEKQAFRTKSRRLFENGDSSMKSGKKGPAANTAATKNVTNPAANTTPRTNGKKLLRPPTADLLELSDPIIGEGSMLTWGPIGEPVERPGSNSSNQSNASSAPGYFGWPVAN